MSEPYTSKKLLGQPSEPELVKKMMKTKLFKQSKQAGSALIVFSLICWLGVVLITLPYITDRGEDQSVLDINDPKVKNTIDPVLLQGIIETNNPSDKPEQEKEDVPETLELI